MLLQQMLDTLTEQDSGGEGLFAKTFPRLCAPGSSAFAVGQPPGWDATVLRLLGALNALADEERIMLPTPRVKEKFGELRVHMDLDDLSDALRRRVRTLIEAAAADSVNRCVRCGRRGIVTTKSGWISPRCSCHASVAWTRRTQGSAHVRMRVAAAVAPTSQWRAIRTSAGETFHRCGAVIDGHDAALEVATRDGQPDVLARILGLADGAPTLLSAEAMFAREETLADRALAAFAPTPSL